MEILLYLSKGNCNATEEFQRVFFEEYSDSTKLYEFGRKYVMTRNLTILTQNLREYSDIVG